MRRQTIIIGAPGTSATFLVGVDQDLANYPQFLRSPSGGAWRDDEISVLRNPTWGELSQKLKRLESQADYSLVVFSGHGRTNPQTFTDYVLINDQEEIRVNQFRTRVPRQLVLFDACRSFPAPSKNLVTEQWQPLASSLSAAQARTQYGEALNYSKPRYVVCKACEQGNAAADTSTAACSPWLCWRARNNGLVHPDHSRCYQFKVPFLLRTPSLRATA